MAGFAKSLLKLIGWLGETAAETDAEPGNRDYGDNVVFHRSEEEYAQGKDEESLDSSEKPVEVPETAIFIKGLKPDINKSKLELYFEDFSRSGGGEITEILIDQTSGRAIVWFEEAASEKCF